MNVLKRLRMQRHLTLKELADKAAIDPATVSLVENGRRKARGVTLGKLAEALDVPVDDLLELLDESPATNGKRGGRPRKAQTDETPTSANTQSGSDAPENRAA